MSRSNVLPVSKSTFLPKPMTTKQVFLSGTEADSVGIYFLSNYPVAAGTRDPAQLDAIATVERPSCETSTENFFAKGELCLRTKYHAEMRFRVSRVFI